MEPPQDQLAGAAVSTNSPGIIQPQLSSRLLALPVELKIHIYAYVVEQRQPIDIRVGTPPQPALLCTCREIRKDASPIYGRNNFFSLYITYFSKARPVYVKRMRKTYRRISRKSGPRVNMGLGGAAHWSNFMAWLQACHKGVACSIGKLPPNTEPETHVVAGCLEMAATARKLRLPWKQVVQLLNTQSAVLASHDKKWAVDK